MFADSCLGTGQASVGTIQARQGRQSLYIEPCGCGPWISNSLSALDFLLSCPLIFLPSGPQSPCLCLTLPSPSGAPLSPHPHPPAYFQSPSFASILNLFISLFLNSLSISSLLQSLSLSLFQSRHVYFPVSPFFPAPHQSHPHPLTHNLTTFLRSLIAL